MVANAVIRSVFSRNPHSIEQCGAAARDHRLYGNRQLRDTDVKRCKNGLHPFRVCLSQCPGGLGVDVAIAGERRP